jgi:hypothetical protein
MAFPDDALPVKDCCEICGVELGGEIVIQEFADGSLARLCPECAAGAALDERQHRDVEPAGSQPEESGSIVWPDEAASTPGARPEEPDPLEKTRELLMPVSDLIALQGEMQGALERLAGSLERFAAEFITEAQGKSAAESRLRMLEHELDETRARLQEAERSLTAVVGPAGLSAAAVVPPTAPQQAWEPDQAGFAVTDPILIAPPRDESAAFAHGAATTPDAALTAAGSPATTPAHTSAEPSPVRAEPAPVPAAAGESDDSAGFRIEEVQAAQRYYNESPFIERVRDVHRSLGKPKANLTKVPGVEPRAVVTVAWDIVWYQYLVYLRRDLPASHERVVLHREGMDLDELAYYFKEKNAVINDDGRLDASELEVHLLSDPSALITEMSPEEKKLLEDATEEIWDQHVAPEFKWDD